MNPPDYAALNRIFRAFIYDDKKGQAAENRLLFYFAGHGETLKLGENREMGYIVAANAPLPRKDRSGFLANALDMETIAGYARNIGAKHALFVFDSCFVGSVFDATRGIPDAISYKAKEPVRQLITSGSKDEKVPVTSFFQPRFVDALRGDGDFDHDGYVTGGELGYVLNEQVMVDSRNVYHPQYGKILDPKLNKGDFVFQLPATPPPSTPPFDSAQDRLRVTPTPVVFDDLEALATMEEAFGQAQAYEQRAISAELKLPIGNDFLRASSAIFDLPTATMNCAARPRTGCATGRTMKNPHRALRLRSG
jgi:hypothetical protein